MNCNQEFVISDNDSKKEILMINNIESIGEKVKIAILTKNHENIILDCFRNSTNEVIAKGADIISFKGYYTSDKVTKDLEGLIVSVIENECEEYGINFHGLQTEEIYDIYKSNEYQFIGFATGFAQKENFIDGSEISKNNKIIGIESSGINNSGFSLIQKKLRPSELNIRQFIEKLETTLGEELVKPAICYKKIIDEIKNRVKVKGINYVSDGGLVGSIRNLSSDKLSFNINKNSFCVLPVFDFIKSMSAYDDREMFNTYNMGIGMVLVVEEKDVEEVISITEKFDIKAYEIGTIN